MADRFTEDERDECEAMAGRAARVLDLNHERLILEVRILVSASRGLQTGLLENQLDCVVRRLLSYRITEV
jgi:hypothetical protein